MFYKNDKLAVVIDGICANGIDLPFKIDWSPFLAEFARRGRLMRCSYVCSLAMDERDGKCGLKVLTDWMTFNGYDVVSRDGRIFEDFETGKLKAKDTCVKVLVTLTALELAAKADHIVMLISDSSYVPLVEQIKAMGVRVSILSTRDHCSTQIRAACDNFIDIRDLEEVIGKDDEVR